MMTCLVFIGYSQNCQKPFNIKFENRKTTSIDVSWSDINTAPLGWEIELIRKGEVRTGIANFKNISEKKYTFTNLTPSIERFVQQPNLVNGMRPYLLLPFWKFQQLVKSMFHSKIMEPKSSFLMYLKQASWAKTYS